MIKTLPGVGLFFRPGAGKTVTVLTAAEELIRQTFEFDNVLVVAPLRVAQDTWHREIAKWQHLAGMRVSKVLGTAKERERALTTEAEVYVINRENVPWLVDRYGKDWPFRFVVVDELTSFKSPTSTRWRALRKVRGRIQKLVGLTGTPTPNGYVDLYAQVHLIDRGERLGQTLTQFREQFLTPGAKRGHIVYEWRLRPGAQAEIDRRLSDICASVGGGEMAELTVVDRHVGLTDDEWALYRKLQGDLVAEHKGQTLVAATAAALSNKLLQITSGRVYTEQAQVDVHDAKLEALQQIVDEAGGPVLCFYWFKSELAALQARFPTAEVLRDQPDLIARWNARKVPLLAVHPASAAWGLNLQDGGSTVVWTTLPWSLELYEQGNARLARQGQAEPVVVHHLVVPGSIDEDVSRALRSKAKLQEAMLQAVQMRLEDDGRRG